MAEASATPSTPVASTAAVTSERPATAQPTPAAVARMMKLRVDGQEIELPESEVLSRAQKASAADNRFQEAAKSRREAEQIIQFAKANPTEFFKRTGMNARQWAEDFLLGEIQREAMSPEQKKAYENEQRLKQYEAGEKQAKDRAHQEQMAKLEQQHMQTYDAMFVKALSECGLPKTPYTVKRMAELTLVSEKKGLKLEASQLAKIVREDYIAEQRALYGQADGDTLLELLGKDAVKRLSKAQLSKYKATKGTTTAVKRPDAEAQKGDDPVAAWKAMRKKTRSLY